MSYDKTPEIHARSRADNRFVEHMQDFERAKFLKRLDAAPFEVTDWEAEFIGSFFERILPPKGDGFRDIRFTAKQRDVIDEMRKKYEGRL
jgi:hypothetical protein